MERPVFGVAVGQGERQTWGGKQNGSFWTLALEVRHLVGDLPVTIREVEHEEVGFSAAPQPRARQEW